jgi:hypothetical protein
MAKRKNSKTASRPTAKEALEALRECQAAAHESGAQDMTPGEIYAEIRAARAELRRKKIKRVAGKHPA